MFKYIPFVPPWDKGLEGAKWGLQDRWGENQKDFALFLPSQWLHFCFLLDSFCLKQKQKAETHILFPLPSLP